MYILAEHEGKIYGAVAVQRPSDLKVPFPQAPFPCLLWDHGSQFTDQDRSLTARVLLDSGCRYAVCAGKDCEAWHDTIDAEFMDTHQNDSEKMLDEALVMTTWHDGETADEVALFFVMNTNFENHDFQRYLLLHIGTDETTKHVDAAVRKYALDQNEG